MSRADTILVVDDAPESLRLLVELLSAQGFQVRPADSGELALAFARATAPDLVLLDVRMPGMDGFEVCRRLKADPATRDAPLLFLSGATDTLDHAEGFRLGAVDFIDKPFDAQELLARVRTHLELHRLRHHLQEQVREKTLDLEASNAQLKDEIRQREQAETDLRESTRMLRLVADHTYDWEWFEDPAGSFLYSSPSCLRITGFSREELPSDVALEALIHPEDLAQWRAHLADAKEPGRHGEVSFRIRSKDGSWRWLAHVCQPVYQEGRYLGQRGSNRDISEKKRWEAEQAMLRDRLEQAQRMVSLGCLAGGVAHEMNNVLGAILGLASANLEVQPPNAPGRHAFEVIVKAATRGREVVHGLLAFTRQERLETLEVDLNRMLRAETLFLGREARPEIRLELEEALQPIQGDRAMLSQAFTNLCANALDAMPDGGVLTLRSRNVSADWIEIEVEDTGTGMPGDVLERALDPFFTTKDPGKGVGLGLSLVYVAVKAHGGELALQSEPGRGTLVRLQLPVRQQESGGRPAAPGPAD